MALVTCPDCGKSISGLTPACPHCGRPATAVGQPAGKTIVTASGKRLRIPVPGSRRPSPLRARAASTLPAGNDTTLHRSISKGVFRGLFLFVFAVIGVILLIHLGGVAIEVQQKGMPRVLAESGLGTYGDPEKDLRSLGEVTSDPTLYHMRGEVIQVLNDGVLIDGGYTSVENQMAAKDLFSKAHAAKAILDAVMGEKAYDPGRSERIMRASDEYSRLSAEANAFVESVWAKGTFLVTGIDKELADGDTWKGKVTYLGLFKYTAVTGAGKTVRRFRVGQ